MITQMIISVVGVLVSGLVGWIFGRRKMLAETRRTEMESVEKAIQIWRITAEELKKEVLELKKENECWRNTTEELKKEITALKNENGKLRNEVNKLRSINCKIIATLEKLTPHNIPEVIDNIKNINNSEL